MKVPRPLLPPLCPFGPHLRLAPGLLPVVLPAERGKEPQNSRSGWGRLACVQRGHSRASDARFLFI